MKISKLLMLGLFCTALVACSSNDNEVKPDPEVDGMGYMSIVIKDGARTETRTEDATVDAEDYEKELKEVLVAMDYRATAAEYPAQGAYTNPKVMYRSIVTLVADDASGTRSTIAFPVTPGVYRVWVIGNPTTGLKNNPSGMNPGNALVGTMNDPIAGTVATDKTAYATGANKTSGFLMFNECNSDAEFKDGFNYVEIEVKETHTRTAPATNDKLLVLERLAARIDSKIAPTVDIAGVEEDYPDKTADITITYKGAVLLNGARALPLVQHWNGIKDATTGKEKIVPTVTQNFNNVNNVSGNRIHYWTLLDYRASDGEGDFAGTLFSGNLNTNATAQFYCMENKPDITTAGLKERKTGLVHKFNLKDENGDDADRHFYYFCQTGLLYDTQAKMIAAAVTFYRNNFTLLETSVSEPIRKHLKDDYNYTDEQINNFISDPGNATSEMMGHIEAAIKTELEEEFGDPTLFAETKIAAFHDRWHIKTYWNGDMYYTYTVKDKNYDDEAVYRNTIYDLTVKALGAIGTYLPETNVDDKQYMKVEVEVKQWVNSKDDNITLN